MVIADSSGGGTTVGETMIIGDVELEGVTMAEQSGGQNAPTKKTEKGYDYTSSTGRESLQATFEVTLNPVKLTRLAALRNEQEPIMVSIGIVSFPKATIDDIRIRDEAEIKSHYDVQIDVREVREALTGAATLQVETENPLSRENASVESQEGTTSTTRSGGGSEASLSRDTKKTETKGGPEPGLDAAVNGYADAIGDWLADPIEDAGNAIEDAN
ncbi:hypothetical protein BRC90_10810 [Halobacteriales archaeon QS_4_69_34]|nr:MAG: hypothetical protein BRC90_10810 [Halobacteriales archaeon QS_4_69_34]